MFWEHDFKLNYEETYWKRYAEVLKFPQKNIVS